MSSILETIKGKKTYILTFLSAIYAASIGLDLLPSVEWVWLLLGSGTAATIRNGLPK